MNLVVIPVAEIERRRRLRTHIGSPHDPGGIDDRHLNDDLAQHVGRVGNGGEIDGVLAGLDAAPQVQERLVDLSDRTQHVLLEHHCEIVIAPFGLLQIGLHVFGIFQDNGCPNHRYDDNAEDRRASTLCNQFWQSQDVQVHRTVRASVQVEPSSPTFRSSYIMAR